MAVLEGHQYGIQAVVFSPDGKYLVSVGYQVSYYEMSLYDPSVIVPIYIA